MAYQSKQISVNRQAVNLLRVSIGIIYLWFGGLKFFHGYSPAEELAINTISKITLNLVPQPASIILLAVWECTVGILLIAGRWLKPTLSFLFLHMACTFTPLLFFPSQSFAHAPYGFTLVGQYIMKNIIIICAAMVIWPAKANPYAITQ